MRPRSRLLTCAAAGLALSSGAAGAVELLGRAVLPSATVSPGPTAGQFSGTNANGAAVPFANAQPVQGFSAVLPGPATGTYLTLSDNGLRAQGNSADALLRLYAVRPDFTTGAVTPVDVRTGAALPGFTAQSTIQLSDPNRLAGFPIVADRATYPGSTIPVDPSITAGRLLTGADFDPESFRRVPDGSLYFGEEFGPFLLHTDAAGRLLEAPIALPNLLGLGADPLVRSPQAPGVTAPNLPSSRGFEGTALDASGTRLLAMLEGALTPDPQGDRRLINEFDLATRAYTGRVFQYRVEDPANAIGDLTAISDTEFLVIERDNAQGAAAAFKRIYRIDTARVGADGFVSKVLVADLLNIADPNGLGGIGTTSGVFTFPFQTIESVLPVDGQTLLVTNDNNYPFSSGRTPGRADDNEFILIRLDQPLQALGQAPGQVPEPASLALLAAALGLVGVARRRPAPALDQHGG